MYDASYPLNGNVTVFNYFIEVAVPPSLQTCLNNHHLFWSASAYSTYLQINYKEHKVSTMHVLMEERQQYVAPIVFSLQQEHCRWFMLLHVCAGACYCTCVRT